jgi:glutamate N-acetyltransferase/amino-acid N-acetyltransferase
MKTYGEGKLDVALLVSSAPCTAAATFTRNRLRSASVDVNLEKIADGRAQAVVVNAGVANSSTGQRGLDDARLVTEWAANRIGLSADDVLICSTGVIGHFLPMEKMEAGVAAVTISPLAATTLRAQS